MLAFIAGLTASCYLPLVVLAEPQVVPMKFARSQTAGPILQRRDPITASLTNILTPGEYAINASIGTPPQIVELQVDTGSSDIWVISPTSYNSNNCTQNGCFGGACKC